MAAESMLFALLRAAACDAPLDGAIATSCTPELLGSVYALAKMHDLAHLAAHGLEKLGLPDCEALSKFKAAKTKAVCRYVRLDYEYEQICKTLEEARLPFIPLKGSVLRNHYPEPWMRTSCDIDILVKEDQLDQAVAVLKDVLHYTGNRKGDHDIALYSPTGVNLELHYDMVEQRHADDHRRAILASVWKVSQSPNSGTRKYCMPDELFYFYHIAHMAKHFENGGCGARSILDIWIMNHRMAANREKRETLLQKGGLLTFARAMEQVAEAWFSGAEMSPLTGQAGDYILRGGVYGNNENRAAFGQAKSGGKWRYLITRRVFMPYDFLKAEYPILGKHKWLTPLYQIVRWVRMLRAGRAGRHLSELRSNVVTGEKTRKATENFLRQLGL